MNKLLWDTALLRKMNKLFWDTDLLKLLVPWCLLTLKNAITSTYKLNQQIWKVVILGEYLLYNFLCEIILSLFKQSSHFQFFFSSGSLSCQLQVSYPPRRGNHRAIELNSFRQAYAQICLTVRVHNTFYIYICGTLLLDWYTVRYLDLTFILYQLHIYRSRVLRHFSAERF